MKMKVCHNRICILQLSGLSQASTFLHRCLVAAVFAVAFGAPAGFVYAQTVWDWRNDYGSGNQNWGATHRWWASGNQTLTGTDQNIQLTIGGSQDATQVNDVSGAGVRGVTFSSGSSSRTVGGNLLKIGIGGTGKIENASGNTQTLNLALSNSTANGLEINPVSGLLNISNIHLGTNFVDMFGGSTVHYRGNVSGSAPMTWKTNSGTVTAIFSASNTLSSSFNIERGYMVLSNASASVGTGVINIGGAGNSFLAELQLGAGAAQTNNIANSIDIKSASGNVGANRSIASLSSSGTNVVTGRVTNNNTGLTAKLYIANGGTLRFSNVVSGDGGFYLENAAGSGGTLELSSSNTITGGFYIDAGTIKLSGASANAGNGALHIGANNGSAAASVLYSGTGGGITASNTLTVNSGSGGRTIISENTSGVNTFLGSATLNKDLTFSNASGGEFRFGNTFSGSGGIAKNGAGTMTFTGDASGIGGTITVNAGRMQIGAGGTTGSIGNDNVTVASGANLAFNRSDNLVYAGVVSSDGAVTKLGAGTVTMSGANSYTGVTTISAGALRASNNTALGTVGGGVVVENGAALELQGGITIGAESLNLSGAGLSSGGALRNISGSNTYGGAITNTAAARINSDSGTLTISGAINANNQALTLGGAGNVTVSSAITNSSAGLTKDGTGVATLGANNSYTGNTTINAGTLVYNGNNTSTAVAVNNGGTLAGTGSLGATTINSGGTMNPGNSPGSQSYSSLLWEGGGNYNWQLLNATGVAGTGYDTFATSGTLTINANSENRFNINLWTLSSIGPDVSGSAQNFSSGSSYTWTIGTFGSISGFSTNAFNINTNAVAGAGGFANPFTGTFSISTNSTQLLLSYTAAVTDYNVTVASGAADQGAAEGGAGQFTGVSALNKLGAGTLVMTNSANSYSGVTTVQAGTLQIDVNAPSNAAGALGNASSAVVIGNSGAAAAAGFNIGAANVTNSRDLSVVAGTGAADRTIGTTITSGTAVQAGNVNLATNALLSAAAGGTMVYTGVLSNSGNITVTNGGTTVLSGANTYGGTTTVANGATLVAANNAALGTMAGNTTVNSGGTLALSNGITEDEALNVNGSGVSSGGAIRNLSGSNTLSGSVTLAGATRVNSDDGLLTMSGNVNGANNALTVGGSGNTTVSGNVTNSSAGLTKDGAGTATLSGVNTYTGTTTVNAGTLAINGGSAISDSGVISLSNNAGATLAVNASETIGSLRGGGSTGGNVIIASGQTLTNAESGSQTFSGSISGAGGLTKSSTGTMTLGGANAYTGALTINGGTVALTSGGTLGGTNAVRIASGATLNLNNVNAEVASVGEAGFQNGGTISLGSGNLTVSGNNVSTFQNSISGTGGLIKSGSGTLNLYGTQGFTGGLTVNAGELNSDVALASTAITVGGGTLYTATNVIADAASVTVNGGTLRIGGNDTIGALSGSGGTVNVASSGSTLTTSFTGSSTYGGTIVGSGNINKASTGTLTLSGNNSFTGSTDIDGGTLALSGSGSLASSSAVRVGTGATFDVSGVTSSASVAIIAEQGTGDGGAVKLGSKNLTMTGGNTNYFLNNLGVSGDTGSFTLNAGSSTLSLYGTSLYTGATTLSAGTLSVGAAMSSASYALGGGNLTTTTGANLSDSASVVLSSGSSTFTVGASDSIGSFSGTAGTVSILTNVALTTGDSGNATFSGVVTGPGALIKAGAGTFTLNGTNANTYSGTTTVNAGVLVLAKTNVNALAGTPTINSNGTIRLGAGNQFAGDTTFLTVNSGGVFDMNGFNETLAIQGAGSVTLGGGTMTINPTGTDTFSGGISGAGGIVKTNTGTQILSGNSSYTATTTVGQGVLVAASANALGATNGATTINTGTALQLSNASSMTVAENITVNGTGVGGIGGALVNTAGTNTVSGNLTLGSNARLAATGGRLTVSGNVGGGSNVFFVGTEENIAISGAISGAGNTQDGTTTSLFKDGAKTLTLSGNNTYTGDTRISQGNITVASGGSLGNGSDVFLTTNGTLTVNTDTTVATLQEWGNNNGGTASIGAGATLTVNGNATNFYMNSIGGAGGLTKSGSGTMNLYGNQSYTGTTTVSAGKLSSAFALSSTNVTVSGGTFEANGANILGDTAAVNVSGGTYDLGGNDAVGAFSISGGSIAGTNNLTAATYALDGGTVTANLGGGTATASSGTTALNGTLGATTVNISGGTVNLGSNNRLADGATVNVSSGALGMGTRTDTIATLNVSGGSVTGSTGNKLTATTYNLTGGTVGANLGAGTLNANSGSATLNGTADATTVNVGGGALTLGSANRLATSNAAVTISNGGTMTLGGNETIASLAGTNSTLALGANNLTLVGNSYSNTFGGVISGSGGLYKYGTGYLALSGNNTYGGGTFIYEGTLDSDSNDAFGTGWITVFSGGTLDIFSHNVTNHIVNSGGTIRTGTNVVVSDVVATNGTTDVAGSGSTIVDAGGSATVNVTGNSVTISNVEGSANVNVGGTSAAVGTVSGGTVNLSNSATGATVTTASAGTVNANASGVTISNVQGSAAVNIAGTGASVRTVSGGTVTLSNTATGATVTTASGGTVNANASGATVGTVSGAAVNVAGANGRVGTLSGGSVAANAAGLVISNKTGGNLAVSNGVTVGLQAGNSSGAISGQGGIVKQGATTLTLSGVNTFTGGATVEQGKLVVNGSVNNSAVTVQSGARIGGSGSVGSLTLNGILAPGNSAGTTTSLGTVAWNQGGSYDWEIFSLAGPAGTGWDLLSVTGGSLDLTGITGPGGFTINLITLQSNNSTPGALTGFVPSASYTGASAWMIASAPSIAGFTANLFTLNTAGFVGATGTFALEERGGDLFLTYTGGAEAIPEPGTWAAAALLAGAAGYVRWRRRKQAEPKA